MFDEPAGLAYARDKLYVADTNNHRIRVIDLADGKKISTLEIARLTPPAPPAAAGSSCANMIVRNTAGGMPVQTTEPLPRLARIDPPCPGD